MPNNPTLPPNVSFALGTHDDVILIQFQYDPVLIQWVKKLTGAKWSQSKKT